MNLPRLMRNVVRECDGDMSLTREILAEQSVEGLAEAIADGQGTIHVIYTEPISDTEAILKYRRGKYQGS